MKTTLLLCLALIASPLVASEDRPIEPAFDPIVGGAILVVVGLHVGLAIAAIYKTYCDKQTAPPPPPKIPLQPPNPPYWITYDWGYSCPEQVFQAANQSSRGAVTISGVWLPGCMEITAIHHSPAEELVPVASITANLTNGVDNFAIPAGHVSFTEFPHPTITVGSGDIKVLVESSIDLVNWQTTIELRLPYKMAFEYTEPEAIAKFYRLERTP